MKSKYNKLTCLFGHHDYSEELTLDKDGNYIYLCEICKRSGYWKSGGGKECWDDYDEEGNRIHSRWGDGSEVWKEYNDEGNLTHSKWRNGSEYWYDKEGNLECTKWPNGRKMWF